MESDAVKKAREFKNRFEPDQGCDYKWVIEHSKQHFARLSESFRALDEKADQLISYLGGGTGLFTLGAVAAVTKATLLPFVATIPSVVMALIAIQRAVQARRPTELAIGPSIEDATLYVSSFQERSEAYFLGQWHLTCEQARLAVARKGELVRKAVGAFQAAVWLLLFPLMTAIATVAWPLLFPAR